MSQKPIIILGAPRSGTNMLRDILCQSPNLVTWPCDEINQIWKYNNYKYTDELGSQHLNKKIIEFIKNKFLKISKNPSLTVVEKTCANTLRPEFVYRIFPEAKFIFIYRNGYDCAISAKKKKTNKFDIKYQLRKLRYAPIKSLPTLILDKFGTKLWGPNYNGMKQDVNYLDNLEISSKQWMKCNQSVLKFIHDFPDAKVKYINYEQFVSNPKQCVDEILNFLSIETLFNFRFKTEHIFKSSIGNSERELSLEERKSISIYVDRINQKLNIS